MALLKFNKEELVNLEYSLKREILGSNRSGTYFNTSIIACNTRKYHGLLVVPIESMQGRKFVLLSAMDESIVLNGKLFNLGIRCYGDVYDPKGHKYIIDFDGDSEPEITYKVGKVILKKSFLLSPDKDQVLIRYQVVSAPEKVGLVLKPFLAFRNIHALTQENAQANTGFTPIANGVQFRMYDGFPDLNIQTSQKCEYRHQPYWYKGVTYSDEYRRGYDCREDLLVPGSFYVDLKEGSELIVSAATQTVEVKNLKSQFSTASKNSTHIGTHRDLILNNARMLKVVKGGKKMISAGYTWLEDGLLRETILSLSGLTLFADGNAAEFEEILDNLIAAESERLYHRTTQIEAPLAMTDAIQQYVAFTGKEKEVWKKYGPVLKGIIESYTSREEASICPNGLLWCQKDRTALSWMNTYVNGRPVNERAGFQVETNALWFNALCFAIEMEEKFGPKKNDFISKWAPVRDAVQENFEPTFIVKGRFHNSLADYVDNAGQHTECRPNMLWAAYIPYHLLSEELWYDVVYTIHNELVTRRGIRSLSPRSADYKGVYEGSQINRDLAYFNGCTHTLLLGPYVSLCFRMYGPAFCGKAKWLTEGFFEDVNKHGVGMFSELYDGDPPHEPHGAIACATATSALARCIFLMDKFSKEDKK